MKESPVWLRTDAKGNSISAKSLGKKKLTKQDWVNIRSATPSGFAKAFYEANKKEVE